MDETKTLPPALSASDWDKTRRGPMNPDHAWIETFTGKRFYPLNPRLEDVDIRDIAHGLSMLCRWTGQCLRFHSVAEHSLFVSALVEEKMVGCSLDLPLAALLHDAAEAYLGDLSRPLKHHSSFGLQYQSGEDRLVKCIEAAFGFFGGSFNNVIIKWADEKALDIERQLNTRNGGYQAERIVTADGLWFLPPEKAEEHFLRRFYALYELRKERYLDVHFSR